CKIMEDQVFPQPQIASKMAQFKLVKADVTENSPGNQALMEKFGLFGPPSILFFDTQGKEIKELRIVGEVTAQDFEQRLASALSLENSATLAQR
ncbi:MAG: thiol:disulfide interchange protein, partial [Oleiphilaceae bacterium]|nr:thiol:disulfide interchange protein [Oleiphilaceae bacterium]